MDLMADLMGKRSPNELKLVLPESALLELQTQNKILDIDPIEVENIWFPKLSSCTILNMKPSVFDVPRKNRGFSWV